MLEGRKRVGRVGDELRGLQPNVKQLVLGQRGGVIGIDGRWVLEQEGGERVVFACGGGDILRGLAVRV